MCIALAPRCGRAFRFNTEAAEPTEHAERLLWAFDPGLA
jgi:hypothetical protein